MYNLNMTKKSDSFYTKQLSKGEAVFSYSPLYKHVEKAIKDLLLDLDGQPITGLYDTVLAEVEAPLLKVILNHCKTQMKAAEILGLSRGTLNKKLKQYRFIEN